MLALRQTEKTVLYVNPTRVLFLEPWSNCNPPPQDRESFATRICFGDGQLWSIDLMNTVAADWERAMQTPPYE